MIKKKKHEKLKKIRNFQLLNSMITLHFPNFCRAVMGQRYPILVCIPVGIV